MEIYRNAARSAISFKSDIPGIMPQSMNPWLGAIRWVCMCRFLETRVDTLLPTLFLREPYSSAHELEVNGLADKIRHQSPEFLASIPGSNSPAREMGERGLCELVKRVLTAASCRNLERDVQAEIYLSKGGRFRPKNVLIHLPFLLKKRLNYGCKLDHLTLGEKHSKIWGDNPSHSYR